MRARLILAIGIAGVATVPAAGAPQSRVARARVLLEGPLERVVLETTGRPRARTELTVSLSSGERRTVALPTARSALTERAPELLVEPTGGRAELVGWVEADAGDELPAVLRARPRPPLVGGIRRVAAGALAILFAVAAIAWSLVRLRRFRSAIATAWVGACAVAWVQLTAPAPGPGGIRVLEGDLELGRWMLVEGRVGGLSVAGLDGLWLEPGAASTVLWDGELRAEGALWSVEGAGGSVLLLREARPGLRFLRPSLNAWGDLERVWTRGARGGWRAHGAWALGAPLPEPRQGVAGARDSVPAGWLASGLPQGVRVLVAELAPGSWSGGGLDGEPIPASRGSQETPQSWLRVTRFGAAEER